MKIATLPTTAGPEQDAFRRDFRQAAKRLRPAGPWREAAPPEAMVEAQAVAAWPAPRELFLAYGDDGALLASCGASIALTDPAQGFLGFFEAADGTAGQAAARAVLAAGEAWLGAKGVRRALGPVNLCTWLPYRFQAEAFAAPPRPWEPCSPPHYLALWQAAGYLPAEHYFSEAARLLPAAAAANAAPLAKAEAHGYAFRPFERDPQRFMSEEVEVLHRLTLASFSDNFLFEPLPLEFFRQLYLPIVGKLAAARFSWFALAPDDGAPCAFLFAFEEQGSLVLKTVGVVPAHRGHSLQMALLQKAVVQAVSEGLGTAVSALLKAGIASEKIPALFAKTGGALWRHRYVLLEKAL
jgi:GNAT superfamily N-acetyltransferase